MPKYKIAIILQARQGKVKRVKRFPEFPLLFQAHIQTHKGMETMRKFNILHWLGGGT